MIKLHHLTTFVTLCALLFSSVSWAAGNWQYYQDKAMTLYQNGDYIEAEKNAKYAAKIAKEADNGTAFRASSLNLLAFIQIAQGKQNPAIDSINDAIRFTKSAYDDKHPQVATLLFNKGNFLEQADQPLNAIEAYTQAWDIQQFEDVQANDILKTVNALTRLHNESQNYAETISIVEEFMKGRSNEPFSELFRQINYSLAEAYVQQNQQDAAQRTLKEELEREQNALESNDVHLAETLERLAAILEAQGKQSSATPLRKQALTIRSTSSEASLANIMNLNELALDSQQKNDYPKAKALYQEALAGLHKLNHAQGIEQALILGNLGSVEEDQGNTKEALTLYQQSLVLHDKIPTQPLQAAYTAARAGAIFYTKRDYLKAEPLFLQSLSLMEKAQAPTASKQIALENLIALYDAWNKNREESKYLKQLKALKK
ncbi:tetratricopeptide repeat protein [Marinomonas shanghaiensis]|uniref:tetratricopeptide repeat protein n=1 Tax=Marinomonas shanghaiensis TaxID=2202418 RepID=UPI000DB9E3DE|nr:tetratricopeptide repeat protein [Marinomonas shanghaiensis]